jgi:acyl carrier protein
VADGIRRILAEEIAKLRPGVSAVDSGSLLGTGGLEMDSLTIAELAVGVETELGVDLIGMEIDQAKGMTVEQFAQHIQAFLSGDEVK